MKSKSLFIKKFKPITPGQRGKINIKFPKKILKLKKNSKFIKYNAGRNSAGKITVRHRGGRNKRILRLIDFSRNNVKYSDSIFCNIEYDPFRKSSISRLISKQFKSYYVLTTNTISNNIKNMYSENLNKFNSGDCAMIKDLPIGTKICNIQVSRFNDNNIIKSAGTFGTLVYKNYVENFGTIKLPSKKKINVDILSKATVGAVDNVDHKLIVKGKAGVSRWLGFRPSVRGNAQNPFDHPSGGKTGGGGKSFPLTKWGKVAKWVKKRK